MCGINGFTWSDKELINKMNEAIKHRGPDGTFVYEAEGVTLGHNRLAIIDLSSTANQPMESGDGRYVIVYNGEIYNYLELKEELKTVYEFKTNSDTEVLLAAYAIWGLNMFPKIRGIFAFGLWDKKTQELLLARDHLGVKPLYYRIDDGKLMFSSELNGLIDKKARLSPAALNFYLSFQYVPSPMTLIEGVEKLRPGHLLRYKSDGTINITRYYKDESTLAETSFADLRNTIDIAVKRQLVSDRPIGAFISGGFDSSIVLNHMVRHAKDVRTFSVDFEMVDGAQMEAEKFNADSHLAKKTAEYYGASHTNYQITLADIRNSLENILSSVDEPVANPTAISQYFLSKWVREDGVVVALGGDGGDELFFGYTRHRAAMAAYYLSKFPGFLTSAGAAVYPRLKKLLEPLPLRFHVALMAQNLGSFGGIKTGVINRQLQMDFFRERYEEINHRLHVVDEFARVDRETWLPDESLARSDRTGMAHGLELRVPLLDFDVVRVADSIPVSKKVSPFKGKLVIRKAYRGVLPEYLYQQPKRGWISPGAKWLRDKVVFDFAKETLSSSYYDGLSELFDWPKLQKQLHEHRDKKGYYLYPLWNIIGLQVWAKKHKVRAYN